jgi:hypothetical protein
MKKPGTLARLWKRLPFVDAYRTFCIAPSRAARALFEGIREHGGAALT